MLKIAICDDELLFCQNMEKIILAYCLEHDIEAEIRLFLSGEAFISLGAGMGEFHIIYLDIKMKGLDGIETAEKIRRWCNHAYIVFVTAFVDYMPDGYRVEAIRYILKNQKNMEADIRESLTAILKKMDVRSYVYTFDFKEGSRKLSEEQIVLVESDLHVLKFTVNTPDGIKTYCLQAKLNEVEKIFKGSSFVRIHQSYLVNMKYVEKIYGHRAFLWDGKTLPVSRAKYQNAKERFLLYEGEI